MKKISTNVLLVLMLVALFGAESQAQEKEESQIKIKITRDINGEKKTYEGSYESEEQMQADENLKEFLGEEGMKTNFWFGGPQNGTFEFEEDENGNAFMFRFHDEEGPHQFQFRHPDDSALRQFHLKMEDLTKNFEGMDEEFQEKMNELQEKYGQSFVFTVPDIDFDFDWNMPDSLARQLEVQVRKMKEQMKDMETTIDVRVIKKLEISEHVGDDFGKRGVVKESNKLVIPDLSYYPNPSPNGRFKLRFSAPGEGELSIKVFNLDGKEVFNRYFESFEGLYSESIDLSRQTEGIYMLEIQQEGKRLTRKIVIN